MTIRMSGLISNMDTDSIIKDLMAAQRTKSIKLENKQTKLTWSQEKWKELNTKIYALYTDSLSDMRLQGNYAVNKAGSTNEKVATITASATAPQGTNTLQVNSLASSQYVTSGKVSAVAPNTSVATSSKLVDLIDADGNQMQSGTLITIKSKNNGVETQTILDVDEKTTVSNYIQKLKDAGLNASFDATQQRFFISAKNSGTNNTFTITSSVVESTGVTARDDIKDMVNYTRLGATQKTNIDNAIKLIRDASSADIDKVLGASYDSTVASEKKLKAAYDTLEAATVTYAKTVATNDVKAGIKNAILKGETYPTVDGENYFGVYDTMKSTTWSEIQTSEEVTGSLTDAEVIYTKYKNGETLTEEDKKTADAYAKYLTSLNKKVEDRIAADVASDKNQATINNFVASKETELYDSVKDLADADITLANGELTSLGIGEITGAAVSGTGMNVVKAEDSVITLNGATLTGSTNTITANGMTINLLGKSAVGETVNLTVSSDTQATYDKVKNFIKSYNALIKEMNTLYDAPSSKGYDPLTDDEKETMTDDQIEKWETKIKDSLLRRDSKLDSLLTSMKSSLTGNVKVNGKNYSFASFGIQTSTDYTEKGLLHIYGDKDDATYKDKDDKLMKALQEDPDTVVQVLAGVSKNLYDTMTEKMKSSTLNSAMTFYNDKEMTKLQTQYKKQLTSLEDRLQGIEDRYYKQFSAMETAMAKLNSQSSALAGMLGTSS